ncbi:RAQPRD family integrative conjugative element protein [Shewanella sp. JNE4-2]|uniref:Integrative conjugative element protein, RAQPRD family n=1 Tax=Shewanella putrefaciens (strain 200) TaxID=399804 RepID=E6XG91_SHEP2|nr:RAQPRD family integrative conjugative element protein [Shewanella sp. JNE4-2]MCK7657701.1 hypothetical protein [Shewanella sp. JNE4-2]
MKITKLFAIGLLLVSSATQAADATRERMGLEVMRTQVSKLLEQAQTIKMHSDSNAKVQFNYSIVERQLKQLESDIDAYLNAPLTPRPVPVF